jgi:hypothetical protein
MWTRRSLDISHCLKIGTEGISTIALLTGLTKLVLDRAYRPPPLAWNNGM